MGDLTADIRDNGLIEPLVVVPGSWGRPDGVCGDCGLRQPRHTSGVLSEHVVEGRPCPGGAEPPADDWVLLVGSRRFAAARAAGLATVPCVSRFDLGSEVDQVAVMVRENVHRADLRVTELAEAFGTLRLLGWTSARQAQQVKVSKRVIDRRLRLMELPARLWRRLDAGRTGLDEAEAVLGLLPLRRAEAEVLRGGVELVGDQASNSV